MALRQILILCRKHLGKGDEASARVCLADAIRCHERDDWEAARSRALRSLLYSVGALHRDYQRAAK